MVESSGLLGATLMLPDAAGLPAMVVADDAQEKLSHWIDRCGDALEPLFVRYGGLLFRGFQCPDQSAFINAVEQCGVRTMDLLEESSRRKNVQQSVYTSTEHPPPFEIFPHHESSYSLTVPGRVFFLIQSLTALVRSGSIQPMLPSTRR